jgi:type I restriction-modification system DNA methylase subunit
VIQDPAAGTGGFLIAANHYLRQHNDFDSLSDRGAARKYRTRPSTAWSTCRTRTAWR